MAPAELIIAMVDCGMGHVFIFLSKAKEKTNITFTISDVSLRTSIKKREFYWKR